MALRPSQSLILQLDDVLPAALADEATKAAAAAKRNEQDGVGLVVEERHSSTSGRSDDRLKRFRGEDLPVPAVVVDSFIDDSTEVGTLSI